MAALCARHCLTGGPAAPNCRQSTGMGGPGSGETPNALRPDPIPCPQGRRKWPCNGGEAACVRPPRGTGEGGWRGGRTAS
jgi:hypothetical protein